MSNIRKSLVREPIIHISRRTDIPRWHGWLIRCGGVLAGLLLSGLIIFLFFKVNPISAYGSMINGVFGEKWAGKTFYDGFAYSFAWIRDTMILLLIAVGLAPAFKMRFWNIGAEGQILVGAIAAAACMIFLGARVPSGLLLVIMAVAAVAAGAVWGLLPALAKSFWKTNETLFTLMMNYIALLLMEFFVAKWEDPPGSNSISIINRVDKTGWIPPVIEGETFGTSFLVITVLVLIFTTLMYVYLKHSKQGYEIAVVGESENTARYSGISVKKVVVRSMTLSSAICGLAGFFIVAGRDHTISDTTAGGRGFTAIIVAWLAKFNPFVMILIAAFLTFMDYGAKNIATRFNVPNDFSQIITGILLFCILGCEFFINYSVKLDFGRKGGKE